MILLFYVVVFVVPGLAMLAGHWFPWPRRLHRVEAYLYGVLWIQGVPTALVLLGQYLGVKASVVAWAGLYVASALGAGLATVLAYGIDALLNVLARRGLDLG